MITNLRRRFVLLGFAAAFCVLLLLLAFAFGLSYRQILKDADNLIELIVNNGGLLDPRNPLDENAKLSPETVYETRYFTVWLDSKGKLISLNAVNVSSIDTLTAKEYAQDVFRLKQSRGRRGSFRFGAYTGPAGYMLVFVDLSKQMSTFARFTASSLAVAAGSLIAILLLLALLAGRAVRPIVESYEKQKRFITDAGHELKTPLTIIDADCAVLEMEGENSEWLRDIRLQTKRMSDLTQDMIYLARMNEDGVERPNRPFPLSDLIKETVREFQGAALAAGLEMECEAEDSITVSGDEREIGKLLSILLDNAVRHTDGEGKIQVRCRKEAGSALLRIENPAEHLPSDALPHLFDRFYRADPSRQSASGGSGLGLAIADAIVRAHQGSIRAEKSNDKTLAVCVKLPLTKAKR